MDILDNVHKCCEDAEFYLWFGIPNLSYCTEPAWWLMVEGNTLTITYCPWCGADLLPARAIEKLEKEKIDEN